MLDYYSGHLSPDQDRWSLGHLLLSHLLSDRTHTGAACSSLVEAACVAAFPWSPASYYQDPGYCSRRRRRHCCPAPLIVVAVICLSATAGKAIAKAALTAEMKLEDCSPWVVKVKYCPEGKIHHIEVELVGVGPLHRRCQTYRCHSCRYISVRRLHQLLSRPDSPDMPLKLSSTLSWPLRSSSCTHFYVHYPEHPTWKQRFLRPPRN